MRIRILVAGKIREPFLREGVSEYLKRLTPYARVEVVELQDDPVPDKAQQKLVALAKDAEAQRILRAIRDGEYVVALDVNGQQMSSVDLSRWLRARQVAGDSNLAFVVGGTMGLSHLVLDRAQMRLSMGPLTFPHQFVPLLLLEQLYRSFRIASGEKYHW